MKTVLYLKTVGMATNATADYNQDNRIIVKPYYSPELYMNFTAYTIEPEEVLLILLNVNDMIYNLNICCGKFNGWAKDNHLCLLIKNISTTNSISVGSGTSLHQLLDTSNIESQLSCIPFFEFYKLYNQFSIFTNES
jgi:hypothetical protein